MRRRPRRAAWPEPFAGSLTLNGLRAGPTDGRMLQRRRSFARLQSGNAVAHANRNTIACLRGTGTNTRDHRDRTRLVFLAGGGMSESQMRAQNATKQRSVFVGRELFDELKR
ncbi:unnamed protein product [Heligmosomoides polygyrus]|uniref:BRCT domain-containing protein n=1 Tax=Heligmosomoides polygyrus TaxID=6339 RepID=A0A183FM16_HELPZ|nr:unnamed protein product [Heligmosomoides polygyrus]